MPKRWSFTKEQQTELEAIAKTHSKPYVRMKALALVHVARGRSAQEAAELVLAHRVSVGDWARRYLMAGPESLLIGEGRGRKSQIDAEELETYLRQSPRVFGIAQTRWSLSTLAQAVPFFRGMSPAGVLKALSRHGYSYKRGQPHLHSPDPDYTAKKRQWTKL